MQLKKISICLFFPHEFLFSNVLFLHEIGRGTILKLFRPHNKSIQIFLIRDVSYKGLKFCPFSWTFHHIIIL